MNLPYISDILGQSSVGGGIVEPISCLLRSVTFWSLVSEGNRLTDGGWLARHGTIKADEPALYLGHFGAEQCGLLYFWSC